MNWVSNIRRLRLIAALVAIVVTPLTGHAVELIGNGSFETGVFGPLWVHGAYRGGNTNPNLADHVVLPDMPFNGNYSALLGFKYTTQTRNAAGYMYQEVTLPANLSSARLFFQARQQGYDSTPYDPFRAQIRRTNNTVAATVLNQTFSEYNNQFKDSGWLADDNTAPAGYDMMAFAGQTVRVYFEQANTIDALYETWAFVDNVSLVYTMFVDLAVDGNGDDVFGALGSGVGGVSAKSGLAADTLVYQVTVENEGVDNDNYRLSLTPPAGWTALLDDGGVSQVFPFVTPVLNAGEVRTYDVYLVPAAAATGAFDVILDAESVSFGTRFDSATLRATLYTVTYGTDLVVQGNGFGIVGDNGAGGFALLESPSDSLVTYALALRNTGDAPTAYEVSWVDDPGAVTNIIFAGVPQANPFTTMPLAPGSTFLLTIEKQVPSPNPGQDYETIVRAVARLDTLKLDSIKAILRVRAPKVDMIIGASGDDIYDDTGSGLGGSSTIAGERGAVVSYAVQVENESSLADSFTINWTPPAGGWNAVLEVGGVDRTFPFTTTRFAPSTTKMYTLKITIPGGAAFGTYASVLEAVSASDANIRESVTAAVAVASTAEIDMAIDGAGFNLWGPIGTGLGGTSTRTVAPGDTVTFSIDLQNVAGTDDFEVLWNTPAGWTVTFDGQVSPIASIASGVYEFRAILPVASLGGTFDIILDARKNDKPFYMDSVLGRMIVVPPPIVDAIIDGNGDDVFGALGSGLGGASSQTQSAPVNLNYTVEIQNQGGVNDQYNVTWNAIPGWTLLFDGSASPYATAWFAVGQSRIYTLQVLSPAGAASGTYNFVIDIVSTVDANVVESIDAEIVIVSPPRVDLVIDGAGVGQFGLPGTGAGGTSVRGANPGDTYNAVLEVRNAGSFADSFFVDWQPPAGWPDGSVMVNDGSGDRSTGFWTSIVNPSASMNLAVTVQVPAGAAAGSFDAIFDAFGALPPNAPESVTLTTQTAAVIRGVVFEDRDGTGALSAADVGIDAVTITETSTGGQALSAGGGRYELWVLGGTAATIVETNPSGFVSVTPDTMSGALLNGGDTLVVDFGDVAPLRISAGVVQNAVAGSFVDFPHRIDAGVVGQVVLSVAGDPSVVTMLMLDANANGGFDAGDRPLLPADLNMDPPLGAETVSILLRVFVPILASAGTTYRFDIAADQLIGTTGLLTSAAASDAVIVVQSSIGQVQLQKSVDTGAAAPGDVLTYTIDFLNTGVDSVQQVEILDPVSPFVDPVADAFGPGQDVEWVVDGGTPVYLTLSDADADECEFNSAGRILRLIFSKNGSFFLKPGQRGTISYRVTVR